jgi:hypothetical protein
VQVEELQRQLEARGAMEDDDCSWIWGAGRIW